MDFPPSIPQSLRTKSWLVETYREDRILVADPRLFDVEPYRKGSVEWLTSHASEWNREDAQHLPMFHEYNWAERAPDRFVWRRCYGLPTDGTHRAVAARSAGMAIWIEVHEYYFEGEAVDFLGLPSDRSHLAPWLVPVGSSPRPLHTVSVLPMHDPRALLHASADEDGLLGFGDQGGVVRVRLYERRERTVVLFSPVPSALWGPSPYGSLHGQVAAMQAIWDLLLVGRARHPLDVEWWAHPGGSSRTWYDASKEVAVVEAEPSWYAFEMAPRSDAGRPGVSFAVDAEARPGGLVWDGARGTLRRGRPPKVTKPRSHST